MWGERAAAGFFEDIHVLIVVVLGMSILLASLATGFTAYQKAREDSALRTEAARILRTILSDPATVHGGRSGLLDLDSIEAMNASMLVRLARSDRIFQLVIAERSGTSPRTFVVETGSLGAHRASSSTAATIWHGDLDIRAARVTITVAGS